MTTEVKLSFHADLVYHSFCHMNLANKPSDLYSIEYINKIKELKNHSDSLENKLLPLTAIYNQNYDRLNIINFFPFYSKDFDELKSMLTDYDKFTKEDINGFILPFIEILEEEKDNFFFQYWNDSVKKNKSNILSFNEFLNTNLKPLYPLFKHFDRQPNIYAMFCMLKNGRGFFTENCLSAAVLLPYSPEKYLYSYLFVLHEMTHQFTDNIIYQNIESNYITHELFENLVIIAELHILIKLYPEMTDKYLDWICENSGYNKGSINLQNFSKYFNFSGDWNIINDKLNDLIEKI